MKEYANGLPVEVNNQIVNVCLHLSKAGFSLTGDEDREIVEEAKKRAVRNAMEIYIAEATICRRTKKPREQALKNQHALACAKFLGVDISDEIPGQLNPNSFLACMYGPDEKSKPGSQTVAC